MTRADMIWEMLQATHQGFVEEPGSPKAINAALLLIGVALVIALEPKRLDEEGV